MLVPESQGGLGLGMPAVNVIAKGLGKGLYPEPFVASGVLATECLAGCDAGHLNQERLASLASGEVVAAVAWQDDVASLNPDRTALRAKTDAGLVRIDGSARFLMTSGADVYIAAAREDSGLALFWVPANTPGLCLTNETRADGGPSACIHFDSITVPETSQIAGAPVAARALARAIDAAIVAGAAELTGVIERMLEITLDYLRTRQQFGKPIGSFQALQHRAVDLWIQSELAKAAVAAAERVMADPNASPKACAIASSSAKSRAADTALLVGKQAIQLHGAIGITDEYDLGLYFNRALVLSGWLGNGAEHRRRYALLKEAV